MPKHKHKSPAALSGDAVQWVHRPCITPLKRDCRTGVPLELNAGIFTRLTIFRRKDPLGPVGWDLRFFPLPDAYKYAHYFSCRFRRAGWYRRMRQDTQPGCIYSLPKTCLGSTLQQAGARQGRSLRLVLEAQYQPDALIVCLEQWAV